MTTLDKLEGLKVRLTFDIPVEEFEAALDAAYHKTAKYYNLPGFRKGKAPRRVIETAFGSEVFFDDAFEILFRDNYLDALKQYRLRPARDPELEDRHMAKGEPVRFSLILETPAVTLGDYKGIEVSRSEYNVTDEQIKELQGRMLDHEKEKQARLITVERPVENGDIVDIDFSGSIDGVKFEGGTAEHQSLEIGSNTFIPGFEEQLVGMNTGDERDINVTFPEDYGHKALAGKDAVFAIKLHGITKKEYPELDDEFAKDVSEFDTFDEYMAHLYEDASKHLNEDAEHHMKDHALTTAVENATVEYPEGLMDVELQYQLRRMLGDKMTLQDFCKMMGYDHEEYLSYMKARTAAEVKSEVVLNAIALAENLDPDEQQLHDYARDLMRRSSESASEEDIDEALPEFIETSRFGLIYQFGLEKARDLVLDSMVIKD